MSEPGRLKWDHLEAQTGLILRGYRLGLTPALAWGACFSPRTPCGLTKPPVATLSALQQPQWAMRLLGFQYVMSPRGQDENH